MQARKRLKKLRPFGVGLGQAVGDREAEWLEKRLEGKMKLVYQWFGLKESWGKGLRRQQGEWVGKRMYFMTPSHFSKGLESERGLVNGERLDPVNLRHFMWENGNAKRKVGNHTNLVLPEHVNLWDNKSNRVFPALSANKTFRIRLRREEACPAPAWKEAGLRRAGGGRTEGPSLAVDDREPFHRGLLRTQQSSVDVEGE